MRANQPAAPVPSPPAESIGLRCMAIRIALASAYGRDGALQVFPDAFRTAYRGLVSCIEAPGVTKPAEKGTKRR